MKRLIKLLSIFGVLIILGSCSSSKSVNVTNTIVETMSVVVTVDESTYTDMASSAYIYMSIKSDDGLEEYKGIKLDQAISLSKDTSYSLSGYYINTSGNVVSFPTDDFSTSVYDSNIKTIYLIRTLNKLVPQYK